VLTCWVRPTSGLGRTYLGFAASSGGAWSVVAAANSSQLLIQNNSGYGFTDVATTSQTWQPGKWYKLTVTFNSTTTVTCNLYDSDGNTLLNTVSYSGITGAPGGVALRAFSFSLDTLQSGPASPVAVFAPITANFVNGVWSGNIVVEQPGDSVVLNATDGIGDTSGGSNPFQVILVPPMFTSITRIVGGVNLTWNSYPGALYQVLYKTNLVTQPNWLNLGSPITAVGSSTTIPDFFGPDPIRFYRLLLLP